MSQEHEETAPTLQVIEGKIFVEGIETIDPELIGMAFKDFAEQLNDRRLELNSDHAIIIF